MPDTFDPMTTDATNAGPWAQGYQYDQDQLNALQQMQQPAQTPDYLKALLDYQEPDLRQFATQTKPTLAGGAGSAMVPNDYRAGVEYLRNAIDGGQMQNPMGFQQPIGQPEPPVKRDDLLPVQSMQAQIPVQFPGIPMGGMQAQVDAMKKAQQTGQTQMDADQKKLAEAYRAQEEAAIQSAEVAKNLGNIQALEKEQALQSEQYLATEFNARREKAQKDVDSHFEQFRRARQDLASSKIDPTSWYKDEEGNKDWGKTIGAAIAVALGAMGSSMTGAPNFALQIIERAIDRNIDAQKTNLSRKRDEVDLSMSELSLARDMFGDEAQQHSAAKLALREQAAQRMEIALQKAQNPYIQANLKQTLANMASQNTKEEMALHSESSQRAFGAAQALFGAEVSKANAAHQNAMMRLQMSQQGAQGNPVPGVQWNNPPTKETVEEARKIITKHKPGLNALGEFIQKRSEIGAKWIKTPGAYQQSVTNAILALAPSFGFRFRGAPTPDQIKNAAKAIGLPADAGEWKFSEDGFVKKLQQIYEGRAGVADAELEALGARLQRSDR